MNKEEIVEKTWLSPREAELYLKVQEGFSVRDAGEEIGMGEGQATSTWTNINRKFKKSQETADLLELPD